MEIIIAIVLLLIFASKGRREVESFCQTKELANGKKIPLYGWVIASFITSLIVLILTKSFGYFLLILIGISWGGPYLHYALSWNLKKI